MSEQKSDALVVFGASGDLAYKKIFPSLQGMIKRGVLDVPVIAVAREDWDAERIRARARESIETHGGGVDEEAFGRLAELLSYVGGDFNDPTTFEALHKSLGGAGHPTFYLAIPPSAFATVVSGLGKAGCADGARVVVEKPFGHELGRASRPTGAASTKRPSEGSRSFSVTWAATSTIRPLSRRCTSPWAGRGVRPSTWPSRRAPSRRW